MKKSKPMYGGRFWGGFSDGKLDRQPVDRGWGGYNGELTTGLAVYTSRALARQHYEDVRRIEIHEVRPTKARRP